MSALLIAQTVIPLLMPILPYLAKGVSIVGLEIGKFAEKKISEKTPEILSRIWEKLDAKIKGMPAAQAVVDKVVANPQDQRAIGFFEMTLEDILKDDALRNEVEKLLDQGKNEGITVEQVTKLGQVLGEFINIDVENVSDIPAGSTIKSDLQAENLGEKSKTIGVRLGSNKK